MEMSIGKTNVGGLSLAMLAQALHLRCEQIAKKHLGFVHGSGAWSQTKLCFRRASARGFVAKKTNSGAQWLRNLFFVASHMCIVVPGR